MVKKGGFTKVHDEQGPKLVLIFKWWSCTKPE